MMEDIWRDTVMTEKIIKSLGVKMLPRDLKYTDPKGPLQALFTNWLPLGKNLINMIIEILPSPLQISSDRIEHLISNKMKPFKLLPKETQELKQDFIQCQSDDSRPVIVFISKMFAADKDSINKKYACNWINAFEIGFN